MNTTLPDLCLNLHIKKVPNTTIELDCLRIPAVGLYLGVRQLALKDMGDTYQVVLADADTADGVVVNLTAENQRQDEPVSHDDVAYNYSFPVELCCRLRQNDCVVPIIFVLSVAVPFYTADDGAWFLPTLDDDLSRYMAVYQLSRSDINKNTQASAPFVFSPLIADQTNHIHRFFEKFKPFVSYCGTQHVAFYLLKK